MRFRLCGPQSGPLCPSLPRAGRREWPVHEASEVSDKLGWLAVVHVLERKELADTLLSRGVTVASPARSSAWSGIVVPAERL